MAGRLKAVMIGRWSRHLASFVRCQAKSAVGVQLLLQACHS
ncbi:hypothetical protein RBSWK_00985 [Rhodopirellula baltica SWK14]|uniref:Uncharacterized protein n=1 Tax=Rhodopirellula baltica SWK14 TaxID=993516 RepID=L7CMF2_RHOBT|nr:hypothetical protein RBSWK_00985 [Rhodopirellula baltica SWK14]